MKTKFISSDLTIDINNNRNIKNKNYKKIYIILTQTKTCPARAIRLYTREPYSHASVALDKNLNEMYSFARRGIYNPFNAGFIREYVDKGVFGHFKTIACSIYQLPVTDEQYTRIRNEIEIFNRNKKAYSYNYLGLIGAAFNIPVKSKYRYFCSQFVAYILEKGGINIFDKNYAIIKPKDIRTNPYLELVYQGMLSEYHNYINEYKSAGNY